MTVTAFEFEPQEIVIEIDGDSEVISADAIDTVVEVSNSSLVEVVGDSHSEVVIAAAQEIIELASDSVITDLSNQFEVIIIDGAGGGGGNSEPTLFQTYLEVLEEPDGINTRFTTQHHYVPGSLAVFLNGLLEYAIYEVTRTEFEFIDAPAENDEIRVCYNLI